MKSLSRETLEAMVDAIPAGVLVIEKANGKIIYVNERAISLYGADPRGLEIPQHSTRFMKLLNLNGDIYPPEQLPASKALLTGKEAKDELIIQRPDSSLIVVDASAKPIFDSKGQVIAAVGIFNDITERKRTQEALKEIEHDLKRAQTVGKIGNWRLDTQRNILLWSDENHRIFGVPKGTPMTYETFLNIVHPDDRAYVDAKWKAGLLGEPYDIEHRIIVKGKVKWVREIAELEFDRKGKLLGGFGTTQEITEMMEMRLKLEFYNKNLEELVNQKTKELKDAERLVAIGATAGMVGHDIRNPLQAITSDLYLIRSDIDSAPKGIEKENIKESLSSIEKNIEYIDKIVQDLQDYARAINPAAKDVDLGGLCEEVLLKNDIPENIQVSYKVEQEASMLVSDQALLKRILNNLTSNAVQAMPKGGKLNIEARKNDEDIVITVEDTGVGITKEVKEKLFTPMFTTKAKGQGFGLSVVKRMTEALGGSVTYESEVGIGTKFIVRLPPRELNKSRHPMN